MTVSRGESVDGRQVSAASRRGQLSFTVVGTPAPQGSKKGFVVQGRAVVSDVNPAALRSWRQDVRQAALEAKPCDWPEDAVYTVSLAFRLPRPKSLRKAHSGRHDKRPDLDKLARGAIDALAEARVFADDSRVWSVKAWKRYEEHGCPPGCDVIVWADSAVDL